MGDAQLVNAFRRQLVELLAILLTGVGKFIFMDWLDLRLPFIAAAITFWIIWVIFRTRNQRGLLAHWGFRKDTFAKSLTQLAPFAVLAVAACLLVGGLRGTLHLNWHILPLLVLYPLWGTVQQFLMIALVAGNLQDLSRGRWPQ